MPDVTEAFVRAHNQWLEPPEERIRCCICHSEEEFDEECENCPCLEPDWDWIREQRLYG